MWIRSQGGNILMDCDSFAVEDHSGKYEVIILNCRTSISVSLGMYSTKEKALKVLDEIQDAIEDTDFYRIDNIGHGTYAFSKGVLVYQMPQDEDAEV